MPTPVKSKQPSRKARTRERRRNGIMQFQVELQRDLVVDALLRARLIGEWDDHDEVSIRAAFKVYVETLLTMSVPRCGQ